MSVCQTQCGITALIAAAEKGSVEGVRLLLEGGANADFKGKARGIPRTSHLVGYCSVHLNAFMTLFGYSALIECFHACNHSSRALICRYAYTTRVVNAGLF